MRAVCAALRKGGGDSRGGADVARLWVATQLPFLLEEEVLDVGVIAHGCSAPRDAVGPVHLGDGGAHGFSRRGQELRLCLGFRLGRRVRVGSRSFGLVFFVPRFSFF